MQIINLRSLPFPSEEYKQGFFAGFKFFSLKEIRRHKKDIAGGRRDVRALADIELPVGLEFDAWYEVAPSEGTNVPEMSTGTTQYESKGE